MKPVAALTTAVVAVAAPLVLLTLAARVPGGDTGPAPPLDVLPMPADRADALRDDALARARVWLEPEVPIEQADLLGNPGGAMALPAELTCRHHPHPTTGKTPKFHCVRAGGEVVKVKFGADNAEVFAEVAASRLLRVLGFGADLMYAVPRVRCFGCPARYGPAWWRRLDPRPGHAEVFEGVSVERKWPGREIQTAARDGWAWYELESVQPRLGGSKRPELDALRLMAVVLVHWDNKAENQRLVCLPGRDQPDGRCDAPFAFVQDLGATFGPTKLDLEAWRQYPVWADPATCRVSMKPLPHGGGTFGEMVIGEAGRRFLAERLSRLSRRQMRDLFAGAHVVEHTDLPPEARSADAWAAALAEKVRQITDRPPCPL